VSSTDHDKPVMEELPSAYRRWRDTRLGQITDALERRLILNLIGAVTELDVLDVGCGDGELAVALFEAGAQVTAVDPNENMLAAARARFEAADAKISMARATADRLPFDNDRFDVVSAIAVLCFLPNPKIAFAEMARVLKPGGRLIVGDLARWSLWAGLRRIRGWLGHPTWQAAHFRSASDLTQLARDAGLEPLATRAAIFYPPLGCAAVLLSAVDRWLTGRLLIGGAFLVLLATKPATGSDETRRFV